MGKDRGSKNAKYLQSSEDQDESDHTEPSDEECKEKVCYCITNYSMFTQTAVRCSSPSDFILTW